MSRRRVNSKKHKHWLNEDGFMVRKTHKISEQHNDVYSQKYHDIETGAFSRWYKKTFPEDYKRLDGGVTDKVSYAYEDYLKGKKSLPMRSAVLDVEKSKVDLGGMKVPKSKMRVV